MTKKAYAGFSDQIFEFCMSKNGGLLKKNMHVTVGNCELLESLVFDDVIREMYLWFMPSLWWQYH